MALMGAERAPGVQELSTCERRLTADMRECKNQALTLSQKVASEMGAGKRRRQMLRSKRIQNVDTSGCKTLAHLQDCLGRSIAAH